MNPRAFPSLHEGRTKQAFYVLQKAYIDRAIGKLEYLLVNQVVVVGSNWSFWGGNSFGITLLPMLFGIGILFWRGKSVIGWLLTCGGALFIFAGIIANMHIYFQPVSLFHTILLLILLVGGLVLIARGIMPHHRATK